MRVRLRFTKLGKIRFLGHRDLARCWERAIRRAELPMAYSEGFSPRPKLHYGLALPTGAESLAEYMDIDLTHDIDLVGLDKLLSDGLPDGVEITGVAEVPSNALALQAVVHHCTWAFDLVGTDVAEVTGEVERLWALDDVPLTFERKGKPITENVRPALLRASVAPELREGAVVLTVDLATKPRSIRPSELLTCLAPVGEVRGICRNEQWMTIDGRSLPPLVAGDPSRPVPEASAP
ncbi:MAG: TIGR03936 family radical SAM-associated protein [Acidimicrobiales bacterium]